MKDKGILYLLLLLLLLAVSCSFDDSLAGGGTVVTNGIVSGIILKEHDVPAPQTQVMLIPTGYNPVINGPVSDSFIDTTDDNGRYSFTLSDTGSFNIQAVHIYQHTHVLVTDIAVQNDTTVVQRATLKDPGVVTIFLPDTIDTAKGYLYFEGTTLNWRLNEAVAQGNGDFLITFDGVPEATFPTIKYGKLSNPDAIVSLTDPVKVLSNDTTIVAVYFDWLHYTKDNSGLPGNTILDIYIPSDSTMWFSIMNEGVASLINNVWTVYNTGNSGLPSNMVRKMISDNNGTMWFATDNGIGSLSGSQWSVYDSTITGMPSNRVTGVDEDSKGTLWFSTRGGSLVAYDDSVWAVYDTTDVNNFERDIIDVHLDNNDMAWCLTDRRIIRYDGGSGSWKAWGLEVVGINSTLVFDLAIDAKLNKWVGFYQALLRQNEDDQTVFNESHSPILSDTVHSVEVDKNNNVWAGTGRGLTTFTGDIWIDRTGERYSLLENKSIRSIAFDNTGFVWLGTTGDGVIAFGKAR